MEILVSQEPSAALSSEGSLGLWVSNLGGISENTLFIPQWRLESPWQHTPQVFPRELSRGLRCGRGERQKGEGEATQSNTQRTPEEQRLHKKQPTPRGRPLLKIIESLEKSEREDLHRGKVS